MRITQRIITPKDWYATIYNRIKSTSKLKYFLKWNRWEIKDVDEEKMFDEKDIIYINSITI